MQNPLRPLTSTLSTYLVRAFGFQREFVGLASFNQLKYGKSYQVFTAHPTRRALPVFLRRNLPQPKKLTFTHLPDFCIEKGYVTVVKTSRTSFLRREEIRMYYSKILQKQYQKHFNLFFLLGSGSDSEETWVQRKVDEGNMDMDVDVEGEVKIKCSKSDKKFQTNDDLKEHKRTYSESIVQR